MATFNGLHISWKFPTLFKRLSIDDRLFKHPNKNHYESQ